MFKYGDDASEVDLGFQSARPQAVTRKKSSGKKAGKPARLGRRNVPSIAVSDHLGVDAKNYNDEIHDPDLEIPE